jgi:hypothetical protein
MAEEIKLYKVLAGKPEGTRPLGRWRHRWENGIRMDLRETGWRGRCRVDSVGSLYGPVVESSAYGDEPSDCSATELLLLLLVG